MQSFSSLSSYSKHSPFYLIQWRQKKKTCWDTSNIFFKLWSFTIFLNESTDVLRQKQLEMNSQMICVYPPSWRQLFSEELWDRMAVGGRQQACKPVFLWWKKCLAPSFTWCVFEPFPFPMTRQWDTVSGVSSILPRSRQSLPGKADLHACFNPSLHSSHLCSFRPGPQWMSFDCSWSFCVTKQKNLHGTQVLLRWLSAMVQTRYGLRGPSSTLPKESPASVLWNDLVGEFYSILLFLCF